MSRCILKPREDNEQKIEEVVIGFDHPLQTWFFQIWGEDPETPIADVYCDWIQIQENFLAYADQKNLFNIKIGEAIAANRCPQNYFRHPVQYMHWKTTKNLGDYNV